MAGTTPPFTLYESFILQTRRCLTTLSNILTKAQQHPKAPHLPSSRLHPDMKSLSYQVFAATEQTSIVIDRLMDTPKPRVDTSKDMLYTYPEMSARVAHALRILDSADRAYIIEHREEVKPTELGEHRMPLSGTQFALIMQANIFFHVSTAYGILRMEGVELGKADFLMPFVTVN